MPEEDLRLAVHEVYFLAEPPRFAWRGR